LTAWKAAGSQWKAWSSRCISVTLKCGDARLHVISCYAPTRAASREEKAKFYDEISTILDEIPISDTYIILGNFNARVGCREQSDDQWSCVKRITWLW